MSITSIAMELGVSRPQYETDWTSEAWIPWWIWTAVAAVVLVVGIRSGHRFSRIPAIIGLPLAVAALVFLCIAQNQMFRHSTDMGAVFLIFCAFALVSIVAGAVAYMAYDNQIIAWVPGVILGGVGGVLGMLNEIVERTAAFTGLTQFGVVFFVIIGAVIVVNKVRSS